MPTFEVKITDGPHVDEKVYATAKEAIEALKVYVKPVLKPKPVVTKDEKVETPKKEKTE